MKNNSTQQAWLADKTPLLALCISFLIIVTLSLAVWNINFWPTDAEDYYITAAAQLPQFDNPSQMHISVDEQRKKWLHGKEMFIVHSAIFQNLLGDYRSLRPLILVCVVSLGLSFFLIFSVANFYWGRTVGWICFLVASTSFWPYVYVLFVKHQPLGLFYFLLSIFFLNSIGRVSLDKRILFFMSGLTFCLAIYSSTVSSLYFPLYCAGLTFILRKLQGEKRNSSTESKNISTAFLFLFLGFSAMFFHFNYPNFLYNVQSYLDYAQISKNHNHFYYNQPVFIQWVAHPELSPRGGWLWVVKYFFLAMPVLFTFYLVCLAYLLAKIYITQDKRFRLTAPALILLSVSAPFLAESREVAQYGANYFPSFAGIVMLVGYALFVFLNSRWYKKTALINKGLAEILLGIFLMLHVTFNFYVFFGDVYPSRMAVTFLTNKIKEMKLKEINSYIEHPCKLNFIDMLDPKFAQGLHFFGVNNIYQAEDGFLLIPPSTGDSIYLDVTRNFYHHFDKDIYLNEIFKKHRIARYAVFSAKTLSSSRIWRQEEEVLSYRDLILNHFKGINDDRAKVWILDVKKLRRDFKEHMPSQDDLSLIFKNIHNIGTQEKIYMYEGEKKQMARPVKMKSFMMRMYKVGNPQDKLIGYVYKLAKDEPAWIPFGPGFASEPVDGKSLTVDPQGEGVKFNYSESLLLLPGPYRVEIYRTGKPDDKNFYRIYVNNPAATQKAIEATNISQTLEVK